MRHILAKKKHPDCLSHSNNIMVLFNVLKSYMNKCANRVKLTYLFFFFTPIQMSVCGVMLVIVLSDFIYIVTSHGETVYKRVDGIVIPHDLDSG